MTKLKELFEDYLNRFLDELRGIEDGDSEIELTGRSKGVMLYDRVTGETAFIDYGDKRDILRLALVLLKERAKQETHDLIKDTRSAGYDYPEFKSIEKSLEAF